MVKKIILSPTLIKLFLILLLALFLRLYHLGSNPPSLNWDEASIGWNAKTIFYTRLDEFGTRLPWSFKSFGDYKAPAYIYLTSPLVGVFGISVVPIRLLSVLAGTASVLVMYLLTSKLNFSNKNLPLLVSLMTAITPWHVMVSRPALEANLALFFTLTAIYLFLLALEKPFYYLFSGLFFVFSLYSYHSPKLFLPFFFLVLLGLYFRRLLTKTSVPWLVASIIGCGLFLWPLVSESLYAKSAFRFQSTSVFYVDDETLKPLNLSLLSELVSHYLVHLSPSFLFFGGNEAPRLQLKTTGPLLLIQAPFLILGLLYLFRHWSKQESKLLLLWLLISLIPAMIGREVPHPLRALNLLPVLLILISLGITQVKFLARPSLKVIVVSLFCLNYLFFAKDYFIDYPVYSASAWQYGYEEAALYAKEHEDEVDKIIFTNAYEQPYVFTYLYQQRDPMTVFWGAMSKYLFREIHWPGDEAEKNTLLIGSAKEIPDNAPNIVKLINYPDGSPIFKIVKTRP